MNLGPPDWPKCFNGHITDRAGCEGCHTTFHVIEPGKVEGGLLVPPKVRGPLECSLCHDSLHPSTIAGCTQCADRRSGAYMAALEGARPVYEEIEKIRLAERLLGWRLTIAGWMAIGAGGKVGGLYDRPGGIAKSVLLMVGWPLAQWGFRQAIKKKQKQLPRIGPEGEVLYGSGPDESEDSPFRSE